MALSFISQCTILCCRSVARKVPVNYMILAFFTACQAFFFSWVCTQYSTESAILAAGMTLFMTISLTIYAYCAKTDFTVCGSLFFVLSIGMIMLALFSMLISFNTWWHPMMAAISVVIYGLYLIFDTQMIAGGRSHEISMDDYVLGALLLYVDIMMLFLELLRLFGNRK